MTELQPCPVPGCTFVGHHYHGSYGDAIRHTFLPELCQSAACYTTSSSVAGERESADATDPVDHPTHYEGFPCPGCGRRVECIDVIEGLGLGYRLGNALKYLWRAGRKGSRVQDLRKAGWYIAREVKASEEAE